MSNQQKKIERLSKGEIIITSEPGNSMVPIIHHRQKHKLAPVSYEQVEIGDVVYCKVAGRMYTHLVKAKDPNKGLQIGNNKGFINGWTKTVYGKLIAVKEEDNWKTYRR